MGDTSEVQELKTVKQVQVSDQASHLQRSFQMNPLLHGAIHTAVVTAQKSNIVSETSNMLIPWFCNLLRFWQTDLS